MRLLERHGVIVDPQRRIRAWNQTLEKMTGMLARDMDREPFDYDQIGLADAHGARTMVLSVPIGVYSNRAACEGARRLGFDAADSLVGSAAADDAIRFASRTGVSFQSGFVSQPGSRPEARDDVTRWSSLIGRRRRLVQFWSTSPTSSLSLKRAASP